MDHLKKDIGRQLLRRYLDDLYTMEDADTLLKQLGKPDNSKLFDEFADKVWEESAMQQVRNELEREKYKKEAQQLLRQIKYGKTYWLRRIILITASIAAMLCLFWGSISYWNYAKEQHLSYLEVSTSYGECRQISLPDGTQLILNSCSRIRYPNQFIGDERRVELDGEGYFKVQHNEEQPFVIKTCRFNVRVLGTCFNVKAYPSDEIVSANVESGKIQIDLPEATIRLRTQEQVLFNTLSGDYNKRREEREVAVWRKGGLRFNSAPMHDVAKELERIYNCHIVFAKGENFDNLISGEHDNKSLESVLQSIEYTSGIHYKKLEGNRILLYK